MRWTGDRCARWGALPGALLPVALVALALLAFARTARAEWLVAGPFSSGPRAPLRADPVMARVLAAETSRWPREGEEVGGRVWTRAEPAEGGEVRHPALAGGYAYTRVLSERARVAICHVRGAASLLVNGEPFVGDPYAHGYVRVPVALREGENHVLARSIRGFVKLGFPEPEAPLVLNPLDATLPDMLEGEALSAWGAIPVLNATAETVRGAVLEANGARVELPPLAPLGILKVPFPLRGGPRVRVRVTHGDRSHETDLSLRVRKPGEPRKRTFVSAIDGSVQYVSVLLPAGFEPERSYALVLSLHGAGVEAANQTEAYTQRSWAIIAAPTNRRRFGFDWEDWGRLDALEVLEQLARWYRIDPSRIYLTGHSMGGHGTWQLATHYSDRFAAAGPSAGWASFWTYGGARRPAAGGAGEVFARAVAPSDTLALVKNLARLPLFVIHGKADDCVPYAETRRLVAALEPFHRDCRVHVEEGAGHWWDRPETSGADCVNLPALFDFFQHHRRPEEPAEIEFRTFSPAVASRHHFVEILSQLRPHHLSTVAGSRSDGRVVLRTSNVAHLRVHAAGALEIDGTAIAAGEPPIDLVRKGEEWIAGAPARLAKSPSLYGPFNQALQRPFVLVYGTAGSEGERRAALARARFDASVWWYRGNGLGRVLADTEVTEEIARQHNLVLYGDEETNACWRRCAERLPVRASSGRLTLGAVGLAGDLAFTAIYPSPEHPGLLLGFVGATGPAGWRALAGARFFVSGAGFPDAAAWDASVFERGLGAVRAALFWGPDWQPDLEALWVANGE